MSFYKFTGQLDFSFDHWVNLTTNSFSHQFINENDKWITDNDNVIWKWFNKLFHKDIDPEYASKLIERAHKTYINTHNDTTRKTT